MKLATPNFKNKTASIIWMLSLAIALIFVDYFYGDIQVDSTWVIKKHPLTSLQKLQSSATLGTQQACQYKAFQFLINANKELVAKNFKKAVTIPIQILSKPPISSILCTQNEVYFLKNTDYTGSLSKYTLTNSNNLESSHSFHKIISKLHSPNNFFLKNDSIYIVEQGLERIIQLTPHSIVIDSSR